MEAVQVGQQVTEIMENKYKEAMLGKQIQK